VDYFSSLGQGFLPPHFERGEGPGDDVAPHPAQVIIKASSETQGQIVGRGKVGMGQKKNTEWAKRAKREVPGENVSPE